jgi:endonuclease IV
MLGVHIFKKNHNLAESLKEMPKFAQVAQVFLFNPQSGIATTSPEDLREIREYIASANKKLVIHGSYVDNPWSSGSVELIRRELSACYECGAVGLVIHLGKKTNNSIKKIITSLAKFNTKHLEQVNIWFEINSAKADENTFETPEKINTLFQKITKYSAKSALYCGICIDTAHLWACGVSWTNYANAEKWLSALNSSIEVMFHLNDSSAEFASGKDKHKSLAYGKIWDRFAPNRGTKLSESGIACVINYAKEHNSIIILERSNAEKLERDVLTLTRLGFL